jgi:ubiquitin carboxyl-terminal hydrolase 22/27/51
MMEAPEVLDAANLCECHSCGRRIRAQRQTSIWVPSYVLVLQLNRFTGNGRKDEREVAFDEVLDLSELARGVSGDVRYRLAGVIHHAGTLQSGHYKVFCAGTDGWHKFDDETCSTASFAEAKTGKAYILFYVKM